jgi:hypothetical protein
MADEEHIPEDWYWHTVLPPEQLDHLTDSKPIRSESGVTHYPYRQGLPCNPEECFKLDGYLCCTYTENGVRKAARFQKPNRFYPIDPWLLEWGDIAGVCKPFKIHTFSFGLQTALQYQAVTHEKPTDLKSKKRARKP